MRPKFCAWPALFLLVLGTTGCGSFLARRMAQAPNTYPAWLAPRAPVELAFAENFLTNFPAHFADVGPPPARLRYRVVEPADYRVAVSSTNWLERGQTHFRFSLEATLPGRPNVWTAAPRGTVALLDLTAAALQKPPQLSDFAGRVSDPGEGRWTSAIEEGAPRPCSHHGVVLPVRVASSG